MESGRTAAPPACLQPPPPRQLHAKGNEVVYSEYSGGHDYVCWRGSLAGGLIALAPPG
jgi:hypothetical protein